jgi:hypothetical protein
MVSLPRREVPAGTVVATVSTRPTPITTTALPFSVHLDAEGVRELRIAG